MPSASDPDGGAIAYSWNGPYLMSSTWSGEVTGSVARTYDSNGWLTSRSVNGAHTAAFGYDDDGLLTAAGALTVTRDPATGLVTGTALGDVTTTMAYNGFGEPESASASFDGTPLYQVTYTRDQLGRITDKVETIQGVTTTWTYRYDLAGRLEEVDQNATPYAEYGFDQNGNRTGYSGFWGTTTGAYDAQDRMTSYGGATYTYTANGELLTKTVGADVTTYNYDVFGSLRAATLPDGTEIEYVIDAQHRRIGKKVNGTRVQGLLYKDQLNPIAELDGSGAVVARFVYGTRPHVPEYMVKGGVTYRMVSDHLGSVRLVVDAATGTVAQRIDFDEYGRVLQDTNPGFQPFGFAGGIWDRDVGLVRFGWRDYDPESGRWTAKDPIGFAGGSLGLYLWVDDEPVNSFDRDGLQNPLIPTGGLLAPPKALCAAIAAGQTVDPRDAQYQEFFEETDGACPRPIRPGQRDFEKLEKVCRAAFPEVFPDSPQDSDVSWWKKLMNKVVNVVDALFAETPPGQPPEGSGSAEEGAP